MSNTRLIQALGILALGYLLPILLHAQNDPESYISVIGRPGVVGAPSPGEKDAVVKDGPRQGATTPIRMKGKEIISVPDQGVVSLLVFSRQHDAGKTAQGSINLKPGTKATVDPAAIDKDEDVLLDLEKGSVQVIKEPKSKGVFRVRTPQATMAVRGTEVWLKHEPAAGGKPANTLCAVPTGTVEATVGDKKIAISAGYMMEIEDGKAKPLAKIKPDLYKSIAYFRTDPASDRWLIMDCHDEVNLKLIDGGSRQTDSAIIDYTALSMSDEKYRIDRKQEGPNHVMHGVDVLTQPINVSKYRYLVVNAMFPTPGMMEVRLYESDRKQDSAQWFHGVARTPQRNKWQWFIYDLEAVKGSDSRLVQFMEIGEVLEKPKGNLLTKRKDIEIREVMFLRELPSSMKDRIHHETRLTP